MTNSFYFVDTLLFAIVPYTFDLLCGFRFNFFVVRISKDPTHVTYHSLTSLISVEMLFLRFEVTAFDELQWYSVQHSTPSLYATHRLPVSINHLH